MASDWIVGVPADIMGMILCRLSAADYIRSSAVCKSWRQVTAEYQHRPDTPEIPYLLLTGGGGGDGNEDLGNLFSLADQKVYHLPHIRGRQCLGSSNGWLVTIDNLAELHLLNPFTGAEATLPSITTFSSIKAVERNPDGGRITGYIYESEIDDPPMFYSLAWMLKWYFSKVLFVPSASAVVAIHGMDQSLAVARVGEETWTQINSPYSCCFEDVMFHKGQFYAVADEGFVVAFEFGNGSSSSPPRITFAGPLSPIHQEDLHYLVESVDGDLLHVCRHKTGVPGDYGIQTRTTSFKIFRLDLSLLQRVELRTLGGKSALFLGNNHSMSLSTPDLPGLKGNCIYFTEDCNGVASPRARQDMGVFNMDDGSVEPFFPPDSLLDRLNWLPSIWITASLS